MKPIVITLIALPLAAQAIADHTAEKSRALWQQVAAHIRRESRPLDRPEVEAYVRRIGAALASEVTGYRDPFVFEVVLSDRLEPESLPSGHVFVPANFLLAAQDESELAAMLAHSMAHVALRHGLSQRTNVVNLASVPIAFVGPMHPDPKNGWIAPLGSIPERRRFELEADRFAIELVARSGYAADALRQYLERTQPASSKLWPAEDRSQRMAALEAYTQSFVTASRVRASEFGRMQEVVRSVLGKSSEERPPTLRRR